MTTNPQIFKATYSGVPVFEMICKGVAVMRRREDSYLNATQILKVAEFDKPQRTRILEREVQKGEHEKVQGGYGKYQGTWVPFERGIALAQQYHVQEHLQPIIDFVPSDKSPPLAPKHITAASTRPRKPRETRPPGMPKLKKLKTNDSFDANSQISSVESEEFSEVSGREVSDMELANEDSDVSMESGSAVSISSNNSVEDSDEPSSGVESNPDGTEHGHHRVEKRHHRRHHRHHTRKRREEEIEDGSRYAQSLLDYFISDSQQVPKILAHPPDDMDINMFIDEEGHTCLHWAAAMGRMKIVKILTNNDANIYRVNNDGQTALMRSVLFTNNSESQTFPQLAELLHKTIFNIDRNDRTVFHHIAATAANKGKVHASRYYMVCLLDRLPPHDSETISILNVQDVLGDTALTIAARIANKKLVKVLLDHGADPHIRNKSGKSAQDYILEAERQAKIRGFPESPLMGSSSSNVQRPHLKAMPAVNKLFEQLSSSYDQDMIAKEHDLQETRGILDVVQTELTEIKRLIAEQQNNSEELEQTRTKIQELDRKLKLKLERRQKAKLKKLISEEEKKLALKPIAEIINLGDIQLPTDDLASSETRRLSSPPVQIKQEYMQIKQESIAHNDSNITSSLYAPSSSSLSEPPSTSISIPVLESHAARLRTQLAELQSIRKSRMNEVVTLKGQTAQRPHDYKKLVSMCCNIPIEQVDTLLTPLIEALNSEEGYF